MYFNLRFPTEARRSYFSNVLKRIKISLSITNKTINIKTPFINNKPMYLKKCMDFHGSNKGLNQHPKYYSAPGIEKTKNTGYANQNTKMDSYSTTNRLDQGGLPKLLITIQIHTCTHKYTFIYIYCLLLYQSTLLPYSKRLGNIYINYLFNKKHI